MSIIFIYFPLYLFIFFRTDFNNDFMLAIDILNLFCVLQIQNYLEYLQ